VRRTADRFGGIDICVNDASAISLASTENLPVKRFDLMVSIQLRGTFLLTGECLPYLRASKNPHILSLSPPLNMNPKWLGSAPAYMLAKYGMSLLTLGWAAEYADAGVAANCLWPETLIATAAVQNVAGGDGAMARARTPDIVADAAVHIVSQPSRACTGNTFIDADVLRSTGMEDLSRYSAGGALEYDIFVDHAAID
jgi:citronellol/citronellal dehydrogenase